MRRRTFDALATTAGFVIAAILLVAGGLLLWGHNEVVPSPVELRGGPGDHQAAFTVS
jgi:hypothetical protein